MKFLYRLFVALTLCGIGFVLVTTKGALDGPQINFDETITLSTWGWLFSMTTGLFAFLFATLYENKRGRR